jgi:hypothetical protein
MVIVEPIATSDDFGESWNGRRMAEGVRTCVSILHSTSSEGVLELGTHKPVSITRVLQNCKVDFEHRHIEQDRNEDQAKGTGNKVPHPH